MKIRCLCKWKSIILKFFIIFFIIFGIMNSINVYAVTYDNGKMWYSTSAYYTFNVKGYYNGSLLRTTYADRGYKTYLKIGSNEYSLRNFSDNGASQTINGIQVTLNLSTVSGGNYVKIEYTVKNNNSSAKTISLATGADIMIGSNDRAPIKNLAENKGFKMSGDGAQFMFIGRNSYGVTDVDTYWFGVYYNWRANQYNQIYSQGISNVDSGMAWSWKDRSIAPGETQKYSVLIGIGQLNNAPTINVTSSVKNTYYRGEIVNIQGTVNDVDYGDVLRVKYAVDDGIEYEIGQSFTPNGTEKPFDLNFSIPTNLSVGNHVLKIWAVDDKGNMSSPKVVNFNVSPFAPPTAPTYKNITKNSFTVEWGTNGNNAGIIYELYDVISNRTVYSGTGTSVTLNGFGPNEMRQYKARSKNDHGQYSDYTSVTTVYTLANQPISKGYDNITSNSVRLLWNPNGNPSYTTYHYEVRRKSDNSLVSQGTVNGTSVTVTGLTGGHEQYRYYVRAKNGNGQYTDFVELTIPSLIVYQKSNYAKAEWGIEMLDSDIIYETGLEDGQEIPTFAAGKYRWLGGQSITTEEKYSGEKAIKVDNTYNNGNAFWWEAESSNWSRMTFLRRYDILENMDLSLTLKAKTTGTASLILYGEGGTGRATIPLDVQHAALTKPIKVTGVADDGRRIYVDYIDELYNWLGADGGLVIADRVADNYGYNHTYISHVNKEGKYIEIKTQNSNGSYKYGKTYYKVGDYLQGYTWHKPASFSTKQITAADGWTTINFNAKVNAHPNFDLTQRGIAFFIQSSTKEQLYVDDIKFGFATKGALYRNGEKIYEGFLSDYDDVAATDKSNPNSITNIDVTNDGNDIIIEFDAPTDNGSTYTYQVKALKYNGDVISSEAKSVTITSGIKGYSYTIDSNPNTVPDNVVDVTTSKIQKEINPNVKNYVHIKVIDNEGNASEVFHQEINIPVLTATPKPDQDFIHLDWQMNDTSKKYSYMVYKKAEGENEFQTIPVKDKLKVLNIYPGVGNNLKTWMETNGYGKGKISVDEVNIDAFNSNPSSYLKDSNGNWKYDVIYLGAWDTNNQKNLNDNAVNLVSDFIESGRGFLAGHDTIGYEFGTTNGLGRLRDKFNIKVGYWSNPNISTDEGYHYFGGYINSKIIVKKKGLLTNYPWKIGDVGTQLSVPTTHSTSNFAFGDIWMVFPEDNKWPGSNFPSELNESANFYLTTWNNTAMIQTGHSNGNATADEQKLIANTLFYLGQITDKTSWDDHSGQDVTGPTKPIITDTRMINNGNTIHIEYTGSQDRGTKYYYYVEASAANTNVTSNIAEATITAGLQGYSIVVDQNPNTIPDNIIETTALEFNINQRFNQKFYVHVAAVDNVGNISEVAHFECADVNPPTLNITGNATNWTNQDVVLTATASDNESGVRGIKLPDGTMVYSNTATFTVTKNGNYTFVAEDNFGNQKSVTVTVSKIDKTPPLNTSIIINNNDMYTNDRDVVLKINASDNATGVAYMRFKTENSPWSAWVPYSTTFGYTMDAGFTHQGTNRVYVQFKDGVGNVGGDAFDSIIFDNIAPTGEIIYPKNTTNTRSITLTINAYDINPASADAISGLNSVRFRELQDGVVKQDWTSWEQHNFTRNWILSDGDGVKVIEMEIRDNAGNIGKVSKSIVLDTLFIKEALFTDIVNPPLGNPELPTSEVVKVKKGYEFTFIVKTTGEPDYATYTFNGETGYMIKLADNLFTKTLKVDINDESVDNELLPINITAARNDGTQKTTTLKVHVEGSAYDDFNINLTN